MRTQIQMANQAATRGPNFGAGLWRLCDPKISLASIASMFLGACAAAGAGRLDFRWLGITVAGLLAIEIAKNAAGEIFDFRSGTDLAVAPHDRSPFSGGKRVLVDQLLTPKQTAIIAAVTYALGIAVGLIIVVWKEPSIFWLGVIGVGCAYFYQAPPLKLSYRGLGELAVALCYGPLICIGTYIVQRGEISRTALLVSIPLGLLTANFLLINEFPDFAADAGANKRTLVVQMGRRAASVLVAAMFALSFGALFLLPLFGPPKAILLGVVGIVPAVAAAIRVRKTPQDTPRLIPAQHNTLLAFLLYALGAGFGLLLVR